MSVSKPGSVIFWHLICVRSLPQTLLFVTKSGYLPIFLSIGNLCRNEKNELNISTEYSVSLRNINSNDSESTNLTHI